MPDPRSQSRPAAPARLRRWLGLLLLAFLALSMTGSIGRQYRENALMGSAAAAIVRQAGAGDRQSRALALRNYIRRHVTWHGAGYQRSRFLRETASETLRTGQGYCGEGTRLFICLAHAIGMPAQRVNLYGRQPHVVAEVQLQPGESLLVDCQQPPAIAGLERLDDVIARHRYGYVDYSTVHLARFHLQSLIRRVHLRLGAIGWWLESPHLLMAGFYGLALCLFVGAWGTAMALGSVRDLNARRKRAGGGAARDVSDDAAVTPALSVPSLLEALRCPQCHGALSPEVRVSADQIDRLLHCQRCEERFPVIHQIPVMLLSPLREALAIRDPNAGGRRTSRIQNPDVRVATAQSFGFEWRRFSTMRAEWERNFLDYMAPHGPEFFRGKRVLDAGCGSGRHAYYAAQYGAEVWAVDLGSSVEVARRNTADCPSVHVVQADLNQPPFEPESFDFIYSIGVLHHLPDPEAGFHNLLRYLKPGGEIQIYLYWAPEGQPLKRLLLALMTAVRQVTTRLPHPVIHAISYPAAWAAYALFVAPYRLLSRLPGCRRLAERVPMKQYAHYPFGVCVNDQFDRLSAPIENRYTKAEVEAWLRRAGLEQISVRANCGWGGCGRKPLGQALGILRASSVGEVQVGCNHLIPTGRLRTDGNTIETTTFIAEGNGSCPG